MAACANRAVRTLATTKECATKKLTIALLLVVLFAVQAPTVAAVSNGEGLYPFTRRQMQMQYGEIVELRVLDGPISVPGNYGWLSWNGSNTTDNLVASLTPPGNAPQQYFNPDSPENGWTPDYGDTGIDVGEWVQGMPGRAKADEVRARLDWHIANKTPMVIPLYDQLAGTGANAYCRVASFAAFELQSYDMTGRDQVICGKSLRWVTNGNWH